MKKKFRMRLSWSLELSAFGIKDSNKTASSADSCQSLFSGTTAPLLLTSSFWSIGHSGKWRAPNMLILYHMGSHSAVAIK